MYCHNCETNPIENKETGLCASCAHAIRKAERQKPPKAQKLIAKVSGKQAKKVIDYSARKARFIKGKRCKVYPELQAEDIHHMMGKVGYADEWARENDVTLLIDERYWLPVSRKAHRMITDDSRWASANGYTFLRVTDPVFRKLK